MILGSKGQARLNRPQSRSSPGTAILRPVMPLPSEDGRTLALTKARSFIDMWRGQPSVPQASVGSGRVFGWDDG